MLGFEKLVSVLIHMSILKNLLQNRFCKKDIIYIRLDYLANTPEVDETDRRESR